MRQRDAFGFGAADQDSENNPCCDAVEVELVFYGDRPEGFGDALGYDITSHGGVAGALGQLETDVSRLRASGYRLTFVARMNGAELHEVQLTDSKDRQLTVDTFIDQAAANATDAA